MKTILKYLMIALLTTGLWQCGPRTAGEETRAHDEPAGDHNDGHDGEEHSDDEQGLVMLTEMQIASAGIVTGAFDTINTSGYISANGTLDLPPENIAAVSAPMAGIVKSANYLEGNYVNKGAELLVLEHPDYIKLQEEYLAVLAELTYLEAEYQRQRRLDSANVAARKALQRAEAEYRTAQARKLSLGKQLTYIGIDPEKVAAGQLSSDITVKAPLSGYITQLNVHKGEFVQSDQELYELINTRHMHLELDVYEKDITKVRKGQTIRFTVPSLGSEDYKGEVFLTGRSFDRENKTVKVHGHFHEEKPEFRRGLYVEATIFTGDERVRALPEEAVVRDEGKTYIFIREAGEKGRDGETGRFRRVEVISGINRNGMVQIVQTEDLPADAAIVLKGAYSIFAEMKKAAGGHGHAH